MRLGLLAPPGFVERINANNGPFNACMLVYRWRLLKAIITIAGMSDVNADNFSTFL